MSDEKPKLHIEFYNKATEDVLKTREAGRPMMKDVVMCRIRSAGDRTSDSHFVATDKCIRDPATNQWMTYIDRFPDHYKAFLDSVEFHGDGTPISELPFLTEAQRANMRAFNVFTAEQLAALDGSPLQALGMGAREMKDKAKAFLEAASGTADLTKYAAENADLKKQMETMQAQIAELLAGKTAPADPAPRPTGSPFDDFSDDDLKNYIADRTGSKPRGTPKRETLLEMAAEAAPAEAA